MPELPDVEAHRRLAARHACGHEVEAVRVPDGEILEGTTPQGLGRSLVGRTITAARRHGKWLVLELDGPRLAVHFRMTGALDWHDDEPDGQAAVALGFGRGWLAYRTERRLGRVHYLRSAEALSDVTGPLGPDALDVDRDELGRLLEGRRGGLKSALMDQTFIAGLGNELVDDILFRAGLHPRSDADLDEADTDELYRAMRDVLRRSVRAGHVPSGPTWINSQRGSDEPTCPNGDGALARATVAGRTTYWCPREQRR
ncbi:MAG: Fpg/Nei family DNA glycosylase [Actinobacteria bacterium]|nr:Fpg/Nei family DNA glycosylase [Actinomycetota bacterium]